MTERGREQRPQAYKTRLEQTAQTVSIRGARLARAMIWTVTPLFVGIGIACLAVSHSMKSNWAQAMLLSIGIASIFFGAAEVAVVAGIARLQRAALSREEKRRIAGIVLNQKIKVGKSPRGSSTRIDIEVRNDSAYPIFAVEVSLVTPSFPGQKAPARYIGDLWANGLSEFENLVTIDGEYTGNVMVRMRFEDFTQGAWYLYTNGELIRAR